MRSFLPYLDICSTSIDFATGNARESQCFAWRNWFAGNDLRGALNVLDQDKRAIVTRHESVDCCCPAGPNQSVHPTGDWRGMVGFVEYHGRYEGDRSRVFRSYRSYRSGRTRLEMRTGP